MHLHIPQLVERLLPRVPPGGAISPAEWKVLEKAAETLLEGSPLEIDPRTVADNTETFFKVGQSQRLWRVRLLFVLLELLPLTVYGRRFTQLDRDQRRRLANEYLASDKRLWRLAGKIRILIYLGAYGDKEAAAPATGFIPVALRRRFREARSDGSLQPPADAASISGATVIPGATVEDEGDRSSSSIQAPLRAAL